MVRLRGAVLPDPRGVCVEEKGVGKDGKDIKRLEKI